MAPIFDLASVLERARFRGTEADLLEFKENNAEPQMIGRSISALANAAALADGEAGYVIWGLNDAGGVVGTSFKPQDAKRGRETLVNWLINRSNPRIPFEFEETEVEGTRVVILRVPAATHHPVSFMKVRYVRVDCATRLLHDFPDHEKKLWSVLDSGSFETGTCIEGVPAESVEWYLNTARYFELLRIQEPTGLPGRLTFLASRHMLRKEEHGTWGITNLGALLIARDLRECGDLQSKAPRVLWYDADRRKHARQDLSGQLGFGLGFGGLLGFIEGIAGHEVTGPDGRRETVTKYPMAAVREVLANALVHQDLSAGGAGPLVELFPNRIEVSNPGRSLVGVERMLNDAPRSRNERLAVGMQELGLCERRGVGIDRIVSILEAGQLPAPEFREEEHGMRVVLHAEKPLDMLTKEERIRACFWHACLKHVEGDYVTNASLRERFGVGRGKMAVVSTILRDAVDEGLVKSRDPGSKSRRYQGYVPFWA